MADVWLAEDTAPPAPRRAQGPAPALRPGPRIRRALPPRGRGRGRPPAPEHRRRLRPRRGRRHLLHRDAVCSKGHSLKELIDAGLSPEHAVAADPPGARGRGLRPPPRDRPPRPEAAERDRRRRGQGDRDRLRDRPRRRLGNHPDRLGDGDPALPLARAGAGDGRDRGLRPLLDRGDALRGADRAGSRSRPTRRSRSR